MSIPIWIYFVVAAILYSAYMTVKTTKEDHTKEQASIEMEGQIYMKRLEAEKQQRKLKDVAN